MSGILITQNYDVINRFENNLVGRQLPSEQSGSMRAISEDEKILINQKSKSEPKTLTVDSSEIVNNVYSKTKDNITYDINGVSFSNQEMKACKEVVKNAISLLPTMGSDLDYNNYASMGIAKNMVDSYSDDNLSEEQAKIIKEAFGNYLNDLIEAEKVRQEKDGFYMTNAESYYAGKIKLYVENDELKSKLTNKIPQNVRDNLMANIKDTKEHGSVVQSATNKKYAEEIMNMFANVNMRDNKAVNELLGRYKDLISPVYTSYGLKNTINSDSLTAVIHKDVAIFGAQISNAKTIIDNVGSSFNKMA